jgi:RHS repeat-associated protein
MVAFAEIRFTPTAGSSRPGGLCGKKYPPHRSAETEKYYVRNGYDSPKLGCWLTRDPIGFPDATEVQVEVSRRVTGGTNLYAYVGSSPVGNVDAWGLGRGRVSVSR